MYLELLFILNRNICEGDTFCIILIKIRGIKNFRAPIQFKDDFLPV